MALSRHKDLETFDWVLWAFRSHGNLSLTCENYVKCFFN